MPKRKQYKAAIGVDEAGRGPLAGPVVAAAVLIKNSKSKTLNSKQIQNPKSKIQNLKDSKKLSPKKREEIYKVLKNHPQIEWGIGRVSEKVIDRINIFGATKLAMKRAVNNLNSKIKIQKPFLLLDGNFQIDLALPQKSIVRGDEKVFIIKLASIVAKVTRDRAMLRYHKKYPRYGFDKHKGYSTKLHLEMLKAHGLCPVHRRSFAPVRKVL